MDSPRPRMVPGEKLPPQAAGAMSLAILAGVAAAEFFLPREILVPVLYGLPLAMCVKVGSRRFLWSMTLAMLVLIFAFYFLGRRAESIDSRWAALVNRSLTAVVLFTVAGLVHLRINLHQALQEQQWNLEAQNAGLEGLNSELSQREEEIVRQNEELQSQTEELERQAEELRLTNEELAAREKSLEQLLELARMMSADLSRVEMLEKICETLGLLTGGLASAVLEKRGNELEVVCHHGFGREELENKFMPYAGSFSSLVISMGQTAYLEDLQLRPDLAIPQPKQGSRLRSVLATPLRIQGRAVGTVEVYATEPRSWGEPLVSVVESLAAQASISLQNVDLLEAIRQERRRFEAAFQTAPIGLAVTDDAQGKEVFLNPSAASMLGVPAGENIAASTPAGARLRRSIYRGHRPVPQEELPLARALRGQETHGAELDVLLPRGETLNILISATPIYDGEGRVAGAVSAFADITALKSLQRELEIRRREAEEASLRKTRFLAAVSHDIRTPANAISLMAELIRRSAAHPELQKEVPELATRLQANTLALMELVGDVLDVARFDSGKVELVETEFSLGELMMEEYRQVLPLAQDKRIELVMEPLERPIWLITDRVKLARVLGNLLGNAIKFTSHGSVRVGAAVHHDSGGGVEIRVSDTGVGIPREHLEDIFDEFAQLHNPERDRTKGSGLGLAICKRLVEVMGGTITVESDIDRGSTFRVMLPTSTIALKLDATLPAPSRAADGPRPDSQGGSIRDLRVLLVEDHATTREGTGRILRQEGATVIEAADGRSALESLRASPPDVVLLDMMLPDMDGREVLKAIQSDPPQGLKGILVLTGDLTPERLEEVRRYGADGLIAKPIDVPKVLAALKAYQRPGSA